MSAEHGRQFGILKSVAQTLEAPKKARKERERKQIQANKFRDAANTLLRQHTALGHWTHLEPERSYFRTENVCIIDLDSGDVEAFVEGEYERSLTGMSPEFLALKLKRRDASDTILIKTDPKTGETCSTLPETSKDYKRARKVIKRIDKLLSQQGL